MLYNTQKSNECPFYLIRNCIFVTFVVDMSLWRSARSANGILGVGVTLCDITFNISIRWDMYCTMTPCNLKGYLWDFLVKLQSCNGNIHCLTSSGIFEHVRKCSDFFPKSIKDMLYSQNRN